MNGKFYKTTVTVDVLSEEPIEELNLTEIAFEMITGDLVGGNLRFNRLELLTGKQVVDALYAVGSEPTFFNLDNDGNLIEPTG